MVVSPGPVTLLHRHTTVNDQQIHIVETIPSNPGPHPTVVLVSGFGTTATHWCAVQRLLSPHIRSFAYDRLGLGQSDRTTLPRPASTLAQELKATLISSGVPPPYLLVGSSYGGIICREYLEKYDEDVAGLVYVDANQENTHIEREWPMDVTSRMDTGEDVSGLQIGHRCTEEEWDILEQEKADRKVEREKLKEEGKEPDPGEGPYYTSSMTELGKHKQFDRQALGERPFSVIVANLVRDFRRSYDAARKAGLGTPEDHTRYEAFLTRLPGVEMKLANEVLQLSSLHRLIYTSISGHLVYLWEPELVVQEIMWCAERCKV